MEKINSIKGLVSVRVFFYIKRPNNVELEFTLAWVEIQRVQEILFYLMFLYYLVKGHIAAEKSALCYKTVHT